MVGLCHLSWVSNLSPLGRSMCRLAVSLVSMAEGVEVRRAASTLRFLPRHLSYGGWCGLQQCVLVLCSSPGVV
jgi:hypothetical protein